jgi:hypothetical protein
MNWLGGDNDDIAECRDIKNGASLNTLGARHHEEVRRVLVWLADPNQNVKLAHQATDFLRHGTGIRMSITPHWDFGKQKDEPLILDWPEACESVVAPVCKFILDQIERHDMFGEELSKVVPIRLCERSGCGRFFITERSNRARFCSSTCRAGAHRDKLSRGEKAAQMRKYRETLKEMRRKPVRFLRKRP